ncbi:hypothetical protein C8Q78DRAFT_1003708 [Trametes maxima]|nr:hypothetical protein C8Q78DRAFT_1003708 [Trametes maxima]
MIKLRPARSQILMLTARLFPLQFSCDDAGFCCSPTTRQSEAMADLVCKSTYILEHNRDLPPNWVGDGRVS